MLENFNINNSSRILEKKIDSNGGKVEEDEQFKA
jgi:hypothetical protein